MVMDALDGNNVSQLVSFKLGIEEYAIDINNVQEIIKVPEITKVPKAPYYVEGVVNLRGNILPIIDTRKRFDMEDFEVMGSTRIVVATLDDMTVGLIVDSVSEVLRVDLRKIEPPPSIILDSSSEFLKGIGKLENGKRLISILNVERVLQAESFIDEMEEDVNDGILGAFSSDKEEVKVVEECQMISFQMGKEEYGVDIGLVDEIIRIPEITTIPDSPMDMKGVICLRGKVLPVISLRSMFGMEEKESDKRTRVLVIKLVNAGVESQFGIIVDQVNEVIGVPLTSIDPPPSFLSNGGHLKGIGKLENGKRLIIVLDPVEIISTTGGLDLDGSGSAGGNELDLILKERASLDELQIVTLKIGNEEFGINIMNVQEIIRLTEITVIPGSPHYIRGVVNLRGNVLPVIDLRTRFEMEERELTSSERIVVTTYKNKATGLIVDSVMEVLHIQGNEIEPAPEIISGVRSMFIDGIAKKDNGKRFIILLSIAEILGISEEDSTDMFDDDEEIFSDDGQDITLDTETTEFTIEEDDEGEYGEEDEDEEDDDDDMDPMKALEEMAQMEALAEQEAMAEIEAMENLAATEEISLEEIEMDSPGATGEPDAMQMELEPEESEKAEKNSKAKSKSKSTKSKSTKSKSTTKTKSKTKKTKKTKEKAEVE